MEKKRPSSDFGQYVSMTAALFMFRKEKISKETEAELTEALDSVWRRMSPEEQKEAEKFLQQNGVFAQEQTK